MKFVIEEAPSRTAAGIPVFFITVWINMLVIGALGHRLNIPYLFKFNYWNVALLQLALSMFRGRPISKFIGKTGV